MVMKHTRGRYFRMIIAIVAIGIAAAGAAWLVDYAATAFIAAPTVSMSPTPETGTAGGRLWMQIAAQLPQLGEPRAVPDIHFTDDDGRAKSLEDFRGKIVVLNLWATWCGPCRREMPTLDRLQAALGGKEFQVVALSMDRAGLPVVQRFYAEIGVKHLAIYIDSSGTTARQLGAIGLPVTLLIDREGREIGSLVGPAEWDAPEMLDLIRSVLAKYAELPMPAAAEYARERARAETKHANRLSFQPLEAVYPT